MYVHLCGGVVYAHIPGYINLMNTLTLQGYGAPGTPSVLTLSLLCRGHVGKAQTLLPVGTCSRGIWLYASMASPQLLIHIYSGPFGCYQGSSPETCALF